MLNFASESGAILFFSFFATTVSMQLYFIPPKSDVLELKSHFKSVLLCSRSMHKLTQLERLDLGNNEFSELVRKAPDFPGRPGGVWMLRPWGIPFSLERFCGIMALGKGHISLQPKPSGAL